MTMQEYAKIKKRIFIFYFLFFNSAAYAAGEGGLPGYYLNLGIGARALGMGRAFTGLSDDFSALYWNPAGLVQQDKVEFLSTHINLFEDTYYDSLGFAYPFFDRGTVAAGITQLYSGRIDGRDKDNYPTGEFSDLSQAAFISYGRNIFSFLSFGISTKAILKRMAEESLFGYGLDAGIFCKYKNFRIGANSQNVVKPRMEGKYAVDEIPKQLKVGAAINLFNNDSFILTTDLSRTEYCSAKKYYGVEINPVKLLISEYNNNFVLRGGYDESRLVYGFGVKFLNFTLDYAFARLALGYSHRVSAGFRFGESRLKVKLLKKAEKLIPTMNWKEIESIYWELYKIDIDDDMIRKRLLHITEIRKDTVTPHIEITTPEEGYYSNMKNVLVRATLKDNVGLKCATINNQVTKDIFFEKNISIEGEVNLVNGENTVIVNTEDLAGMKNSKSIKVIVDTIIPTMKIKFPSPFKEVVNYTKITITWLVKDNLGIDSVYINNVSEEGVFGKEEAVIMETFNLNKDINFIDISCQDRAGNSTKDGYAIFVDLEAPKITLQAPSYLSSRKNKALTLIMKGESIIIKGMVSDNVNVQDVFINDKKVENTFEESIVLDKPESSIVIKAVDSAGNETAITLNVKSLGIIIANHIRKGDDYMKQGDFKRAIKEYEKALEIKDTPEIREKIEEAKRKYKIKTKP